MKKLLTREQKRQRIVEAIELSALMGFSGLIMVLIPYQTAFPSSTLKLLVLFSALAFVGSFLRANLMLNSLNQQD